MARPRNSARRARGARWTLALDPGSRLCGLCLGRREEDGALLHAELLGTIVAPDAALPERLAFIAAELQPVMDEAADRGADVVTERPAVWGSKVATIAIARVGGVLLKEIGQRHLRHVEYSPSEWKQVTGNGNASKDRVAHFVRNLLRLPTLPAPDAADAAGMFIYHATRN